LQIRTFLALRDENRLKFSFQKGIRIETACITQYNNVLQDVVLFDV